jgi:hypothetical protein
VSLGKRRLTDRRLEELEQALAGPPPWVGLAIRRAGSHWIVSVPALYWGVFHLFRRLTQNPRHLQHAQRLLVSYRFR